MGVFRTKQEKNLSWVMGALKDFIVAEYGFV
jgi:hypothetical protein